MTSLRPQSSLRGVGNDWFVYLFYYTNLHIQAGGCRTSLLDLTNSKDQTIHRKSQKIFRKRTPCICSLKSPYANRRDHPNAAGVSCIFPCISGGQQKPSGHYGSLANVKLTQCKWHMYLLYFLQEQWDNSNARNQGLVIQIFKIVLPKLGGRVSEQEINDLWGGTQDTEPSCCPDSQSLSKMSNCCTVSSLAAKANT
ncbi:hypothetical protein K491DRAFT_673791 [Lophiostoma macrostomum CBS 122681]|uniref:Uncharacterized protein n=1 Tax=Lophiostoma macrostomum CBS 122681 TaxID=1314788 RepID=A0A6A6TN23_9PLEO|nr:hypothetical protein K491DRAFT_673791 [Lophiostoma macrostomum CBS 122681]